MKDIIDFLITFTKYAAESRDEAEGIATILFLSLSMGVFFVFGFLIIQMFKAIFSRGHNENYIKR